MQTLLIASDHAGFEIKEFIKNSLETQGYTVKDYGTFSTKSMDYPDVVLVQDIPGDGNISLAYLDAGANVTYDVSSSRDNGLQAREGSQGSFHELE